jgi:hypothetical protein
VFEHDKELNDGIKWIDKLSQEQGISFYDMIYKILYQHDMNQRVNNFVNKHSYEISKVSKATDEFDRMIKENTIHANIYKRHEQTHTDEKNNDQDDEGI